MAQEIVMSFSLSFTKGSATVSRNSGSTYVTVSGSTYNAQVASIATSDTPLDLGGVTTNGFILLHNLDATNYITLGEDGSSYPIKLLAGEWGLVRWNGAAIHAKAHTGACLLEYVLISD